MYITYINQPRCEKSGQLHAPNSMYLCRPRKLLLNNTFCHGSVSSMSMDRRTSVVRPSVVRPNGFFGTIIMDPKLFGNLLGLKHFKDALSYVFTELYFPLTLFKTTIFRLFQTVRVCKRQFQIC